MKKVLFSRSSFSGSVATVFGATGCIGRGVTNKLGKIGTQMVLPYHGEHYDFMRLKVRTILHTCPGSGAQALSRFILRSESGGPPP